MQLHHWQGGILIVVYDSGDQAAISLSYKDALKVAEKLQEWCVADDTGDD